LPWRGFLSPEQQAVPVREKSAKKPVARTHGAGYTVHNAKVTVEVDTPGCEVWAYGAVIDGTEAFPGTNDPTTVPLTIIE
jgi:hypothetical protein